MRITKNTVLPVGTVVALRSGELLRIEKVCREPDGICYRVYYGEYDGEEFAPEGDMRIVEHCDIVGAEI